MQGADHRRKQLQRRVGTVLKGKWRLDELLGVGAMAAVYKATHRNQNEVAIKMLHPEVSFHPEIRQRFVREGYAANKVKHQGAVTVLDDDVADDGSPFLVMELLEGETLEARSKRQGRKLPTHEVLSLTDQLLGTLIAAHEQGVLHRDVKPENLLLTRGGVLKVLDFGIARLRELSQSGTPTQTGSLLGTPAFMAPEQARGRWNEVDERTDLWAVGATMFRLLTGQYVHRGETMSEVAALAATQRARSLETLRPNLHPAIVELVDKALSYEKDRRFADARAMQEALHGAYDRAFGDEITRLSAPSIPDAATGDTIAQHSAWQPGHGGKVRALPFEPTADDTGQTQALPFEPTADDTGETQALPSEPTDDDIAKAPGSTTARGVSAPVADAPSALRGDALFRSKLLPVLGGSAAVAVMGAVAVLMMSTTAGDSTEPGEASESDEPVSISLPEAASLDPAGAEADAASSQPSSTEEPTADEIDTATADEPPEDSPAPQPPVPAAPPGPTKPALPRPTSAATAKPPPHDYPPEEPPAEPPQPSAKKPRPNPFDKRQ